MNRYEVREEVVLAGAPSLGTVWGVVPACSRRRQFTTNRCEPVKGDAPDYVELGLRILRQAGVMSVLCMDMMARASRARKKKRAPRFFFFQKVDAAPWEGRAEKVDFVYTKYFFCPPLPWVRRPLDAAPWRRAHQIRFL